MENTPLAALLAQILSPDNVQRAAAEQELERRSSATPGFSAALADYCGTAVSDGAQRALALVALSVMKRCFTKSVHCLELQQVVSLFLAHLGDVAMTPGMPLAILRQWISVIVTGVRRAAVLQASLAAAQEADAASAAACYESTTNLITSQLLHFLDSVPQADSAGVRAAFAHVALLQTFFEEPVPDATQAWCAELTASCVPPLLALACGFAATPSDTLAGAASTDGGRMRCALHALITQTLGTLYEWQFAASGRQRFPAELKQSFIAAQPVLQPFLVVPCRQWASTAAAAAITGASPDNATSPVASENALRVSPLLAAAAGTQDFVLRVLQYGGWHKRCVTPELLRGLLDSLLADVPSYHTALCLRGSEDGLDGESGAAAAAGPSGTSGDAWVPLAASENTASTRLTATDWAALTCRHATQRWSLFREVALLPSVKLAFVDTVGEQCGMPYYRLMLAYAVLAPQEAEAWQNDPNVFLREEEERDDGVRYGTREMVAQLYTESITLLGPLFLHASLEDLNERLFAEEGGEGSAARADAESAVMTPSQQQREAGLFFMEAVLRRRGKALRECGAADFMPLAVHLWQRDVSGATAHPSLTPRALMLLIAIVQFSCGGTAPSSLSPDAFVSPAVTDCTAVLSAFAGAIASASPPPCSLLVAVLLCRFLHSTLPHWPPALLKQHFPSIQTSLLALFSPQADLSEEALYSAVEQLTDLLAAAQRAQTDDAGGDPHPRPSVVSHLLPHSVMDCWRRHVNDPSFADVVLPLLCRVVRDGKQQQHCGVGGPSTEHPSSRLTHELPWIHNVLCGYTDSMAELCAVPYFMQLLRYIFAHGSDDLANATATLMLDSLCQLLLCTEESAILVASSSCLAALLRRCPAAQSVQVRVVAATVEAAMTGGGNRGESHQAGDSAGAAEAYTAALMADAPRAVYPFSTVIVAIVLRTLDDRRGEASLMEMGQALVTIAQHSTSFSEAELVRVIHATVHRLMAVRTDTVAQELLAPLATLLQLHPMPLLRTLVQGGVLGSTMSRWLPRVEHFTDLRVTVASCEGLLQLLRCMSDMSSSGGGMTAEEGQQVAQQAVPCRWLLPRELGEGSTQQQQHRGAKAKAKRARKQEVLQPATQAGTSVVESSLPLYAAVLVAAGRGFLSLLAAPLPALRRAVQPDATAAAREDDADSLPDGNGLFREDSSDDVEDVDDSWEEDAEDSDDGAVVRDHPPTEGAPSLPSSGSAPATEAVARLQLLGALGSQMAPWVQSYGSAIAPYFTGDETQKLTAFFASAMESGAA